MIAKLAANSVYILFSIVFGSKKYLKNVDDLYQFKRSMQSAGLYVWRQTGLLSKSATTTSKGLRPFM